MGDRLRSRGGRTFLAASTGQAVRQLLLPAMFRDRRRSKSRIPPSDDGARRPRPARHVDEPLPSRPVSSRRCGTRRRIRFRRPRNSLTHRSRRGRPTLGGHWCARVAPRVPAAERIGRGRHVGRPGGCAGTHPRAERRTPCNSPATPPACIGSVMHQCSCHPNPASSVGADRPGRSPSTSCVPGSSAPTRS